MPDLRRAVLVAGLLGQTAVCLAGVLPMLLLPATWGLLVAAGAVSGGAGGSRALVLRRVATGLALLLAIAALPKVASPGVGGTREVLGPLLVGVQIAQALTWRSRRDLQTGLLVAVGLLVLGASYAPDVLVGLPLVAGWAVCVVAVVLLQSERLREGAPASAAWPRPPLLPVTGLALALGLVAFLLVPVSDDGDLGNRLAGGALASASARAQNYSAERLDLRARGALSDRILAEVPDDGTPLWRSVSYSTWDGSAWTAPEVTGRTLTGPPFVVPGAPPGPTVGSRVELAGGRGTVWSPGLAARVHADASLAAVDQVGAVRLPRGVSTYTVDSVQLATDPEVLRAAGPGTTEQRWLQLPVSTSERVRRLAQEITAGAPTTYDKVVAVERWLEANATYRLDSPVPGPDEDAVDRFLFVDRVGFCEQFAAAETVLLRAVGIPARLVVGLAYGESVGAGRRVFRENMLHAWVEVSYAGVGWSPSDPTAGAAQASASPSLRSRLVAGLNSALAVFDRLPGGRPALAVGLLLLVMGCVLLQRRFGSRAGDAAPPPIADDLVTGRPALAAFLRWDVGLGPGRRREAESLTEQRRRLDLPPGLAGALAVVERECYSASPPTGAETTAAIGQLQPGISATRTSGGG